MERYAKLCQDREERVLSGKADKTWENKDMQGYETIWKEKLKFLWYA